MPDRAALVHYHEIGLKGRNRATFERQLRDNIAFALEGMPVGTAVRIASRVMVPILKASPAEHDRVIQQIATTPGVSYVGDAAVAQRSLQDIQRVALAVVGEVEGWLTLRVEARRSSTDFSVSSMEMNRAVGAYLLEHTGAKVDLSSPDLTCHIEVVQGDAYVYARRVEGPGGLPVGTAGGVVALLSAGIDSPVAAWRMMKRGAVVVGVHFSGRPQTGDTSDRLVMEIAAALEKWGGLARVYTVPFGDLQREIALATPQHLRVLLYRRLMVRVAEAIADRERAKALVTGESLGQVASQTLDNVVVVDAAATKPVLRPLIGMDKLEIIAQARMLGTYDVSTQPHDDCCTLFMPRRPATRATVSETEAAESDLDLNRMVEVALASATISEFRNAAGEAGEDQVE